VVRAPAPKINELTASLPAGDRVVVGGTEEDSGKPQASVIAVLPVMLVLMLAILMVQRQGFNRLFLVLSVAPLGLIGVVTALLVSGKPLGVVAILGARAHRHDRPRLGDPHRSGRDGEVEWVISMGRRYRSDDALLLPDPAHRGSGDPRHDPDCAHDPLGADGLRDHGRSGSGDAPVLRVFAGALHRLVPGQEAVSLVPGQEAVI
jgi:hypothetical protein